jgi:hypothetical protein
MRAFYEFSHITIETRISSDNVRIAQTFPRFPITVLSIMSMQKMQISPCHPVIKTVAQWVKQK